MRHNRCRDRERRRRFLRLGRGWWSIRKSWRLQWSKSSHITMHDVARTRSFNWWGLQFYTEQNMRLWRFHLPQISWTYERAAGATLQQIFVSVIPRNFQISLYIDPGMLDFGAVLGNVISNVRYAMCWQRKPVWFQTRLAVASGNSKWSPRFRKLFIFKKIKKIILELLK
jgi:hypothetical protein